MDVNDYAAQSKTVAYYLGLVPAACCILPCASHLLAQFPRHVFPVWYTSAPRIGPRTPQQLLLGDGRRVNHWGDPAWHQVECVAYLVDASWCNAHNGDSQLQWDMADCSLNSVAVESNHLLVLPSRTGVPARLEWWNSILVKASFARNALMTY